jgi:hypothetical protein
LDKKDTVEDCRSISISFLKKHDYLSESSCRSGGICWKNCYGEETSSIGITVSTIYGDNHVRFQYASTDRNTGKKTEYDYKVQLTTTPCNFGGVRYWFICPLSKNGVYCGRRVAKLYKAPGGDYFGCRHCYSLSYESRNETRSGMIGVFGRVLRSDKQIEELRNHIRRRTYRGRPTRKVKKLFALEQRMEVYLSASEKYLKR